MRISERNIVYIFFVISLHVFYLFLFLFFIVVCTNIKKGGDKSSIINEKGCLSAGEEWLENNLLVVAGVAVGIAFLQVSDI